MVSTPLEKWVEESARLTKPAKVVWCDGTEGENERLTDEMLRDGTYNELNQKTFPKSYLHRSNPNDVARTENLTFICTQRKEDAGPTNNWMAPAEAKDKLRPLFDGAMKGRTMYVVPYIMGPAQSPYSKIGVEVTDSAYVVASMRIMSRMGKVALDRLGSSDDFVPGLHSLADLNPQRRFIVHFPEEKLIWSVGSGYGGNALLGKKCFALRIASWMAREQGWMAEHMLILGLEDPSGKVTYMAAAFPSACGKTNLAMMVSALENQGYRVWTVGDDIAWMHIGSDGTLRAINPEAGFFGVAPGTNSKTNPNVMSAAHKNTIYTNVAMTSSREPWWEGIDGTNATPEGITDWKGKPWNPSDGPAAHPNARYTVPASQSPSLDKNWEDPAGVPISAFIFGGRRARLAPLVYESRDWQHGVFVGATMASETTAAATGKVGVTRRDPMAMLPFCGYNMADYFAHWLEMGPKLKKPPKIFHVNWFRRDANNKFLWPGYGENVRVLKWILDRIEGRAGAAETPIGCVPTPSSLTLDGMSISRGTLEELLSVNPGDWTGEERSIDEFFAKFGDQLPEAIRKEQRALADRLGAVSSR
ncbi:MAG TPA: phosphoenolpyruvate carboxykinase (GTP) [Candidatus Acidoferrales bacterium]|jgi:phosphoenolpyruvate carboxykinase (GTP)|nr:phosphoenolpyruvate carboxykinase (GTP) [Candidatus Acidoferrales bacterium]